MNDNASLPPLQAQTEDTPASSPSAHTRNVRSFVLRSGRLTSGQAKALERLGQTFLLPYQAQTLDLAHAFGRNADTILEIGFGMGEASAQIASVRPQDNFLCCEVHTPGVGALLKRVDEQGLANIRIVQHDAVEVIEHMIAHAQLSGVHIFFPDPWHKARHNKRRLIQAPFLDKLVGKIKVGGYIHVATDWQDYAEQILQVMRAQPLLRNTVNPEQGYAEKPAYRPLTKFENRGLKLGHGVWDVVFTRV